MEEPPGLPLLAFWVAPFFLNVEFACQALRHLTPVN